jgi:hypothetical protein
VVLFLHSSDVFSVKCVENHAEEDVGVVTPVFARSLRLRERHRRRAVR